MFVARSFDPRNFNFDRYPKGSNSGLLKMSRKDALSTGLIVPTISLQDRPHAGPVLRSSSQNNSEGLAGKITPQASPKDHPQDPSHTSPLDQPKGPEHTNSPQYQFIRPIHRTSHMTSMTRPAIRTRPQTPPPDQSTRQVQMTKPTGQGHRTSPQDQTK